MRKSAFKRAMSVVLCGALAMPAQSQDSSSPYSGLSYSNYGFSLPVTLSGGAMYYRTAAVRETRAILR